MTLANDTKITPELVKQHGLKPDEFDTYGATARTLRGFIKAYHDLVATVNDIVLPNPDVAKK